MILADKIQSLRKKSGWSQEELADKLNVSRQSISKWESAQSIPDLSKIIDMASLFGVTTDYLLKDDISSPEYTQGDDSVCRKVSLNEANEYMDAMVKEGKNVGLGVLLCILSPITLVILSGLSELENGISQGAAVSIGLAVLLTLVASAVALFIVNDFKMQRFEYLEKEVFELEYGVAGVVKEKLAKYAPRNMVLTVVGVVTCIVGALPLIIVPTLGASDMTVLYMVGLLLALVSVAVYIFISSGCIKSSYDNLLGKGEYSAVSKKQNKKLSRFSGAYWPAVTAGYLLWSFLSNDWNITWLVWPIAALLYSALAAIFGSSSDED